MRAPGHRQLPYAVLHGRHSTIAVLFAFVELSCAAVTPCSAFERTVKTSLTIACMNRSFIIYISVVLLICFLRVCSYPRVARLFTDYRVQYLVETHAACTESVYHLPHRACTYSQLGIDKQYTRVFLKQYPLF